MRLRKEWGNVKLPSASESAARASRSSAASSTANINRQIRALVPGQTIRGEIISRNGNEVQIRLSDDTVLQARVDQNMNLELGKNMTFEVRNNGSALTISPLFTNISADVNVMKAIDMAGLPFNETSVSMTSQMMQAGLSVDRNTLLQVYREVTSYPSAEISDIINLHRLGLPVTDENVNQMIAYRNLNHQLLEGMNSVLDALPEAMEGMAADENLQGLSGLYQELFDLIQGSEGETPPLGTLTAQESDAALQAENAQTLEAEEEAGNADQAGAYVGSTPAAAAGILLEEFSGMAEGSRADGAANQDEAVKGLAEGGRMMPGQENLTAASRAALADELLNMISRLPVSQEEAARLTEALQQFARGQLSTEHFFAVAGRLLDAAQTAENGVSEMYRIFSGGEFKELLNNQLKALWTVKPEEVAEPGKMDELYNRLNRQLKSLSQALETGGQADSAAYRSVTNLSQNLDFMNQLNQMYAYVQLPLHLSQGEAHGELYVYTNKKNLSAKEGKISALLHLDMEHLGPVDVYVTLEQTKVNTRFYVQDEDMLDFLAAHMDILTKRLAERGYDCSFSMTARKEGEEEENTGIGLLMSQEKGITLSQYAFDVRT